MLKGLIFDFDGLMIDTEYTWYPIYVKYLRTRHHYDLQMEDFLTAIGSNDDELMSVLHRDIGPSFNVDHFTDHKLKEFQKITQTLPMMPGVLDLIQSAHQNNIALALATSSKNPHAINHLKRWGIDHLFDVIVTGSDVDEIKPAPDLFLKALDALQLDANECFVLEDSYNGLLAANKAEIDCIVIPNKITQHSDFKTHYKKFDTLHSITIEDLKGFKK